MKPKVWLLNGPNLNLLGEREPQIYGHSTLADVEDMCRQIADSHGLDLFCHQTNAEHQMIEWLHAARRDAGVIINPAGFSYHHVPVLDALKMVECPIVEVHISNVHRREAEWRSHTITTVAATGVISGLGIAGYRYAMEFLVARISGIAT